MKKINLEMNRPKIHVATQDFSERDIISLQNTFLTPGFHSIQVQNKNAGRLLIRTLLKSLNYYHIPACLTTEGHSLYKKVTDICKKLDEHCLYDGHVQDFVIEEMFCDFLWIENTNDLGKKSWIKEFKESLAEFNIDKTIPIIVVSYN